MVVSLRQIRRRTIAEQAQTQQIGHDQHRGLADGEAAQQLDGDEAERIPADEGDQRVIPERTLGITHRHDPEARVLRREQEAREHEPHP